MNKTPTKDNHKSDTISCGFCTLAQAGGKLSCWSDEDDLLLGPL